MHANDLAPKDGVLTVTAVAQGHGDSKSDAFLFTLGSFVLLEDCGLATNYMALQALMDVRNKFMKGMEDHLKDTSIKLKITWVASHWHIDHTGLIGAVASCPYIEIGDAYVPAQTEYVKHRPESLAWVNGDWKYRPQFDAVMAQYQPHCTVHEVRYGSDPSAMLSFKADGGCGTAATFKLFPSVRDWGSDMEGIQKCADATVEDGDVNHHSIPVAIVNSNSLWLEACYRGVNMLFTGDTQKCTDRDDDPMDLMFNTWGREIGEVHLLKYPHHGVSRDKAARLVDSLHCRHILFTAMDPTAPAAIDALEHRQAEEYANRYVISSDVDAVFTVDTQGVLRVNR